MINALKGKYRALAVLAVIAMVGAIAAVAVARSAAPIGAYTTKGAYTFHSEPKLHPPKLTTDIATSFRKLAPGYFMVADFKNVSVNRPMIGQSGPLILDHHLQPVWFVPVPTNVLAVNLRAQAYNGKPVLSWWQGVINKFGATVSGEDVVVDQSYRQVATLTGQDGWIISEHELVISGHNAWVTAYKNVAANLKAYGGLTSGVLTDSAVQEYDLTTGKLLYTWDALQHIPLSQSYTRPTTALVGGKPVPWDAYHVNSIQLTGGETFLVSMRNTWAAYRINRLTGLFVWVLGGKASTFTFGKNAAFQWQHDVELHGSTEVSVFDDHCCLFFANGAFKPPTGPSRGLVLKLDTVHRKATLIRQDIHARNFDAAFLGNTQLLPNGNVNIGWGSQHFFSQYSRSGKLLLDAVWPTPDLSYRAVVQKWVGKPFFPPSGAVVRQGVRSTVYASWDGATQVTKWTVLAGSSGKRLAVVATQPKIGFETAIPLSKSFKVYEVRALDSRGHILGTSKLFPRSGGSSSSPGFY